MSPVPYNIFDVGDLYWVAYGMAYWASGEVWDHPINVFKGDMPEEQTNWEWECYAPDLHPINVPDAPYFNPDTFHNDDYGSDTNGWRGYLGWAYEKISGRITYFLYQETPLGAVHYEGASYDTYIMGVCSVLDFGETAYPNGREWYWDYSEQLYFSYGSTPSYEVLMPGSFKGMEYVYSSGKPLLVVSGWAGETAVSWDYGVTWEPVVWPSNYADLYEGSYNFYEYSPERIAGGPPGSNAFAIAGVEIFRSKDNGASLDVSLSHDLSIGNPHVIDAYVIGCNEKPDPDTVWIALGNAHNNTGPSVKCVQRNLSAQCDPSGWEDVGYYLVSQDFQEDLFEGTVFYPDDYPATYRRGDPYTNDPMPIGMKYFPNSGRWWAFEMGHYFHGHWLIYSDDDGVTWNKSLCDHKNSANWPNMHPFFAPRLWPWSESYSLFQSLNNSGWQSNVCDIIEHPDDPNILITIGEYWLKSEDPVEDPAGRFQDEDGYAYPLVQASMTEAQYLEFARYNSTPDSYYSLMSMGANAWNAMCISEDGGATWGRPFSFSPRWSSYDEYDQSSRLIVRQV